MSGENIPSPQYMRVIVTANKGKVTAKDFYA